MAGVPLTLPSDYWQTFSLNQKDLEFISTYLFENEEPLTEAELVPILVHERIRRESEALVSQQKSAGKLYLPKEHYQVGETLVFSALDWKPAKLTGIRAGVNPSVGEFEVIEMEFAGGSKRQFAAGLAPDFLSSIYLMARCPVVLDDVLSHRPFVDGNGWLVRDAKGLELVFAQIRDQPHLLDRMSGRSCQIAQRLLDYRSLAARILQ